MVMAEASLEREVLEADAYQKEEDFFRIESAMEKHYLSNPLLTGSIAGMGDETPTAIASTFTALPSPLSLPSPTVQGNNGNNTPRSAAGGGGKKKGGGARGTKADGGRGRGKKGPTPDTLLELPPARLPNMFFFRQVLRTALATDEGGGPTQVSPQVLFVMEAAVKVMG